MKKNSKRISQEMPKSLGMKIETFLPNWIVYMVLIAWGYIVINKYYSLMPINLGVFDHYFTYDKAMFKYDTFIVVQIDNLKSILLMLFIVFSAYGFGRPILEHFEDISFNKIEKIIFSIALGFIVVVYAMFLIGIVGVLYKSVVIIFLCCGVLLGIIYIKLGLKYADTEDVKNIKYEKCSLSEKMSIIVIVIMAFFNFMGNLVPETFYDSQLYHLAVPAKWIIEHKISSFQYLQVSNFPCNSEILYMLALIIKNEIAAQMLHHFFGIAVIFAIVMYSKRFYHRKIGLISACVFYTVPIVSSVVWKTNIELILTFFEFMAFYAFSIYFSKIVSDKNFNQNKLIILSGLFLGFALGAKYICIAALISIVFVLSIETLIYKTIPLGKATVSIVLIVTVALLLFSPWGIRNIVNKRNPTYPFLWTGGKNLTVDDRNGKGIGSENPNFSFALANIISLPWTLTMNEQLQLGNKKYGSVIQESFPGPLLLLIFPVLIIYLFSVTKYPKIRILMLYILPYTFLWVLLAKAYMRYYIQVMPIFILLFIVLLFSGGLNKYFLKIVISVILLMCLSNTMMVANLQKNMRDPMSVVSGVVSRDEFIGTDRASYPNSYYPAVLWANNNLPKTSLILFLGETRGYYSKINYITQNTNVNSMLVDLANESKTGEDLYNKLIKRGVTHMLLNAPEAERLRSLDMFYFEPEGIQVVDEFWKKHIKEIFRGASDLALPDKGIYSLKRQVPAVWQQKASNPLSCVFLYELVEKNNDTPPLDLLLNKSVYSNDRWGKLRPVVEKLHDIKNAHGK